MDLEAGFQIEEPNVLVPWHLSEAGLEALLGARLRRVAGGYHTISCTSLGGLRHELGFRFSPPRNGRLTELEFFRRSYGDQARSYEEFQEHLVAVIGPPTESRPGSAGFPSHRWKTSGCVVEHFVMDRFGPEEHVRIRRT